MNGGSGGEEIRDLKNASTWAITREIDQKGGSGIGILGKKHERDRGDSFKASGKKKNCKGSGGSSKGTC